MTKIKFSILLLISIFFVLSSCNQGKTDFPEFTQETKNLLYVFPSPNNLLQIQRVIDVSNINRGGYALIISDESKESIDDANKLRNILYSKKLIAVHTISFNNTIQLLNTEKIAVENSKLIFFIGDFENDKYLMNERSNLGYFLNKAYSNGATVVMIGKSSVYCGNHYYLGNDNRTSEVKLRQGLNLINFTTTFKNNSQLLETSDKETDVLFFNDTTPLVIVNKTEVIDLSNKYETP